MNIIHYLSLIHILDVSGIWLAMPLSEALTIIVILLFVLKHRYAYKAVSYTHLGISKTTPVSSAIFNSMQPIWVFLISVFRCV